MGWDLRAYIEYRIKEETNYWEYFAEFDFFRPDDLKNAFYSLEMRGLPDDISISFLSKESYIVRDEPLVGEINEFVYSADAARAVKDGQAIWRGKNQIFFKKQSASWAFASELKPLLGKLDDWESIQKLTSIIGMMETLNGDNDKLVRMIFWLE